jgi:UDP-2,3-diacylglucosamine pyrophosphatase LpxH
VTKALARGCHPVGVEREMNESLLVLSDVHLGSDLNDSGPRVERSRTIDADLVALVAHYRCTKAPTGRWRLVVAGDFFDLVGMSIDPSPDDAIATPSERIYGLGGAEVHVRQKMQRLAERHADVFAELRRFVADGHAITFVHGNHDLELHWDTVQEDLRARLGGDTETVTFEPWFFYRPGVVFVEHGHQYDPFCATPFVLTPLSPLDHKRVAPSLSDTLLRFIVRRTPGLKEYGHEDRGIASYVSWGLLLGFRGAIGLFLRFWAAVFHLRRTARAYASKRAEELAAEHRARMNALAARVRLSTDRLEAALRLHVGPLVRSPRLVLASVMLDRLGLLCAVVVIVIAILAFRLPLYWLGVAVGVWLPLNAWFARQRPNVDPASLMLERAPEVAKLFPASFVVMGHTHMPLVRRVDRAVYVNVGAWAEEEPEPGVSKPYRAPRTHLVLHDRGDAHVAQLYAWTAEGPKELDRQEVAMC